jgi:hypothetical protein
MATSAARTRRYRARLAGLPDPDAPQPCPLCSRLVRSSRTAPLCSQCWKRSPAGREVNRLRMQARRAALGVATDSQERPAA